MVTLLLVKYPPASANATELPTDKPVVLGKVTVNACEVELTPTLSPFLAV